MRPKMIQVMMSEILVQESIAAAAAVTEAGWTLVRPWCSDKGWCKSRLSLDGKQTRSGSGSLDHCVTTRKLVSCEDWRDLCSLPISQASAISDNK